jgi:hypothetical protein
VNLAEEGGFVMGKVIKLYNEQKEEEEIIKAIKNQKGKSIKLTRRQKKEVKEFKNDINLCQVQIERFKILVDSLKELKHSSESLLDEEHCDERIYFLIKDINILLKEITTLWSQGLSEIRSKLS